jgi:hypothetical protein
VDTDTKSLREHSLELLAYAKELHLTAEIARRHSEACRKQSKLARQKATACLEHSRAAQRRQDDR